MPVLRHQASVLESFGYEGVRVTIMASIHERHGYVALCIWAAVA
jgi:hypothetical protein